MITRATAVAMGAMLILFGAPAAQAADYTFTVPVEVRTLPPEAEEVRVTCTIHDAGGARLGDGRTTQRLTDHGFNGEVRVEVSRLPGERRRATRWICLLYVGVNLAEGRRLLYGSRPGSNLLYPVGPRVTAPNIEPRAGTPVALEAAGTFR